MPGTGKSLIPGSPVKRMVYVYELTNRKYASSERGIFYSELKTRLIKKTRSNSSGRFSTVLPVGKYSILVMEDGRLFSNILDGDGNINPVEVKEGMVSEIQININYKAAY